MSTTADPIFLQAEIAYRRESMMAGAGARRAASGRHHAGRVREVLRGVRAGHRHGRTTPRPA
ncbi:hypothetical protein ACFUC1_00780 [Pedococcus sp. NPDC057267]|uniref:hypothetical protein n=1 Tax=Pedococcus sp. NPDC057267 TaxID=3346077 RepID=UPI00362CCB88